MSSRLSSLTDDDFEVLDGYITELERLNRIHRAEVDLLYFAWEYFSDVRNPENIGNWDGFDLPNVTAAPTFHKEICSLIDEVDNVKPNSKIAVAAPRSHAKSSYLSKASPIRAIVYRNPSGKYQIIISETPQVATANLEWIAGQLKTNEKLRSDFGPLLSPKQQLNPKDNSAEFIAWEPVGADGKKVLSIIQAASTGQALRGRNWNGIRPTRITCDDLEDARPGGNASTAEQRSKLVDWFTQTVMPLGDPKGEKTGIIYMGTIVHAESLLNNVINYRADFKSVKYKALIEEPERMDLWEKCRAIYLDADIDKNERLERAKEFYEDNREEMHKGAVVLWREAQPLWRLMTWKWDNGSKAFNTEYQNTPLDEESQIFKPDTFRYFDESDLFDKDGRPLPLEYYAFWDIAFGKSSRSDYNAIVTIARNRQTGVLYIVDTWAKKCQAHEALEMAIEIIKDFGHRTFAIETVGAQHDLYRQLRERLMKEKIYGTKLKPIVTRSKKEERIESLEPLTESGFLRFKRNQRLLLEQMEQFPSATHDDLPDALAGAVDLAGGTRRRRSFYRKPAGL